MDERLRERVERLAKRSLESWLRAFRGYTPAERWVVRFSDGSSAFAKVGTTPLTSEFLRVEQQRYQELRGDFMAQLLGFEDDPQRPLLLLEDLSTARWPPPWEPDDYARLVRTLDRVAATRPVEQLPSLAEDFPRSFFLTAKSAADATYGWAEVAREPGPFLALGLCSEGWLKRALPRLVEAQNAAVLDGDDLLHCDVRSDNLCLLADRVVLVDWNLARRGNGAFDLAFAAPSLRLEGGPLPEELVHDDDGSLAAIVSGFFASRAGLPVIPDAPRVRWIQLRQLRIALPWVARVLGLEPPDLAWGQNACARIEEAHARGEIDDRAWHEQIEEVVGDSFLATGDPRAQSGKTGDEADWRWSRELVLDAMPGGGSLLDVGCANGYLMESVKRWATERGLAVEPYGVEISWRLAALARRRLPHFADRIWVGNALDWSAPRRFDVVHTGIDYVPEPRRREYVLRLLRDLVVPGGRVVIRAERVVEDQADLVKQFRALGLAIGGVLERRHPRSGELRRTVWLADEK